jgi:glycosyltransferase involved in cell wall biosynthesis
LHENVRTTVAFLRGRGWHVTVFSPPGIFQQQLEAAGVTWRPLDGGLDSPPESETFHLVHAHPGSARKLGLALAAKHGCPFFLTLHGAWLDQIEEYANQCSGIICVSQAIADEVSERAPAFAPRVHVIPNSTLPAERTPLSGLHYLLRRFRSARPLRLIMASRFDQDKEKVVQFLAECWQEQNALSSDRLVWDIVGAGTLLNALQAASRPLRAKFGPDTVRFHGWVDRPALETLYSESDVAVAPGRSAIDAMGRGLPIVAVGSRGCAGLGTVDRLGELAHANFGGFGLVERRSAAATISELVELSTNRRRLAALGRASACFARERFDERVHNQRLLDLYAEAMRTHPIPVLNSAAR